MNKIFGYRRQTQGILDSIQRRLKRGPEIHNSDIYYWFHGLPLEMLLYLAAKASREDVRRFMSLYLTRLRQVRTGLDGQALKSLGLEAGPGFSRIKDKLLAARLNGEVTDDDQERALALAIISSNNHAGVAKKTQ